MAESLIAALLPQIKDSGTDSPPLPLVPAHLPPGFSTAVYYTNKGGHGCVALRAASIMAVMLLQK
ncbi:hypothetical protein HJV72_04365 [Extibacter sp. GGCC_0201]|nr:hypothetical protein [Extibacter sp. GGCC_0201]